MKKILLLHLLCFFLFSISTNAQSSRLEGNWEGTITIGGLDSAEEIPFELYLKKDGNRQLVGRSYIHFDKDEIVEMEVKGTLFGDFSIYLKDTEFIPFPGEENDPPYERKYQLQYQPSIWSTKMVGFWQELTDQYFSEKRRLGRINLKKVKDIVKP
ncbi:MAG: hypothetical protein AAF242_01715 [Bacteroidota bacterium]